MNRDQATARVQSKEPWDFVVIGGGATGLGCAVDASHRGYRTLLLEQQDFAKGTSSRSTKLVHGGVRYLKQGNISLVMEALHERGLLCQNAPHLVHHLEFVVPAYSWWEGPFYGIGMKLYDRLAGQLGLGPSRILSKDETLERIPTIEQDGLLGGVCYFDGQFDDARLAIHLAQTVFDQGGTALNYFKVIRLMKQSGLVCGVVAIDEETGEEHEIRARAVVNATGVFADTVRRLDDPSDTPVIAASQGVHLVLPRKFLPGNSAIMVPHTSDGRVLFAVPWHDRVIVGTTDTPLEKVSIEPVPLEEEIEFILTNASKYLTQNPEPSDVLSLFAGLRPLVKTGDEKNTSALSRDHTILISDSGLLTVAGGKWTTYRRMAEDAVDQAETIAGFDGCPSRTTNLRIHGWTDAPSTEPGLQVYGSDAAAVVDLSSKQPNRRKRLHPDLPYTESEVIWAVRNEMARTVEDVLARRTRALLLGAKASREAAPRVAELMRKELGQTQKWQQRSLDAYSAIARRYVLEP